MLRISMYWGWEWLSFSELESNEFPPHPPNSNGNLIFNMGIAIPGKTVFLIETAPWNPTNFHSIRLIQMAFSDNFFSMD